jgi:hypothetical protein
MVLWETFYPLVMPWAPGAAEINVDAALRQAAIEFYKRSLAWWKTLDRTVTAANEAEVDCDDLTADQSIVKLLSVKLDGRPLDLIRADDLDGLDDTGPSAPTRAYKQGSRTIALYPVPASAGLYVTVRAALMPSQASTGLPDDLYEQDAEAIAAGALKRLCSQPGQSFSNPGMAVDKGLAFEAAITAAKVRAYTGDARTSARVVASYF